MSYIKSFTIDSDNATGDAFGRLRVGLPYTLFDSKQLFDNSPLYWDDQQVSGSGTTSNYSSNRASSTLLVAGTTAGKRVRQTFQSFNYQPGKSTLVFMTSVFDKSGGGTGITRRMGLMNDDNGIFLEDNAGTYSICRRSNATGTPVDTTITQSSWNVDPLDGTGPSGITIDFSKSQIFVIDLEWLGVGRVRVGFNIDGVVVVAHEFNHANSLDVVYMSSPNLPLRYEIENSGAGTASELEAICSSVMVEGADNRIGTIRSASTGNTHLNANSEGTLYAGVGIRLKSAYIGTSVELLHSSSVATTTDPYEWAIIFNPTVAGTFTYNGLTNSAVEVAYGALANTVSGGTLIDSGFVSEASSVLSNINNSLNLGAAIDGTVDEIILTIRPLGANADIHSSLTWKELN